MQQIIILREIHLPFHKSIPGARGIKIERVTNLSEYLPRTTRKPLHITIGVD